MNRSQARENLSHIATAQRKTQELRQYRVSASVVTAWGIVWICGYCAQQFAPAIAPLIWIIGWIGAFGWTITRPRTSFDARALASWGVALAFVGLLLVIIRADARLAAMIFSLVLAASYAILGIWVGWRFAAMAAIVLTFAVAGWWIVPHWFFLALAFGGGGALIIGGQWLRRP